MNLHRWHKVKKGEVCVVNPLHYAGKNYPGILPLSKAPKRSLDDTSDLAATVPQSSTFIFLGMSGRWCKVLEASSMVIGYIGFTRIVPKRLVDKRKRKLKETTTTDAVIKMFSRGRIRKHKHRIFFNRKSILAREKLTDHQKLIIERTKQILEYTGKLPMVIGKPPKYIQIDIPLKDFNIVDNSETE